MDLLLKSEHIKPVKFRIVSNNVQCADFQMLKDNFLISDLQKVNDSRLHRWLISVGQSELAEQIATLYPTSQSISADPLGFLRLFFQEELHIYHSTSDVLYFFKNNRYAIFVELIQSNADLLLEYYHSPYKHEFSSREWLDFFNRFSSEPKCISIISEIKRELIPGNKRDFDLHRCAHYYDVVEELRGFDIVEELLDKIRGKKQVTIPIELYDFFKQINTLIIDLTCGKKPKNHINEIPVIYRSLYNYCYVRAERTTKMRIAHFITSTQFYIYQRIDYFKSLQYNKNYYRSDEIKQILKYRECKTFNQDTFNFIKSVNHLIEDFYFVKQRDLVNLYSEDITQRYKIAYEFIIKHLAGFSSQDSFEYFVCQYLSTVLVKNE